MDLRSITLAQLGEAREAAECLLGLPVRLNPELWIKLDTFRADVIAEMEDRGEADATVRRAAVRAVE